MSETAKNITTSDCIWPHFAVSGLFFVSLTQSPELAVRYGRETGPQWRRTRLKSLTFNDEHRLCCDSSHGLTARNVFRLYNILNLEENASSRDRQVNASEREEHRPDTLTQHCHLTSRFVVQISWSAAHAPCGSTWFQWLGVADTGTEVLSVSANGLLLWNSGRTGTAHTFIHRKHNEKVLTGYFLPPADVTSQLNNIKHVYNNELRVWVKSFKHLWYWSSTSSLFCIQSVVSE